MTLVEILEWATVAEAHQMFLELFLRLVAAAVLEGIWHKVLVLHR
jgi:hypothetical protein